MLIERGKKSGYGAYVFPLILHFNSEQKTISKANDNEHMPREIKAKLLEYIEGDRIHEGMRLWQLSNTRTQHDNTPCVKSFIIYLIYLFYLKFTDIK